MEEKLKQSKGLHNAILINYPEHRAILEKEKDILHLPIYRNGKNFTEAAAAVRISLRTLMSWIKRFRSQGIDGLKDQPYLPPHERDAFRQAVLELQQNKPGGRIRGADVLELMKEMV